MAKKKKSRFNKQKSKAPKDIWKDDKKQEFPKTVGDFTYVGVDRESQSSQGIDNEKQALNPQPIREELVRSQEYCKGVQHWDDFYSVRVKGNECFDFYVDWSRLEAVLPENLMYKLPDLEKSLEERGPTMKPAKVRILVPGCGNSRLSENLYDIGFENITNVDFSKTVITYMSLRNLEARKKMKWQVMDMTDMKQFPNASFDVVLDKGGLDSLMEPRHGPRFGNLYLSEVKRLVPKGGKFICVTLAEPRVIDILLCKFRFGWIMNLHAIDEMEPDAKPNTYVVVLEKDHPYVATDISSLFGRYTVKSYDDPGHKFYEALEEEKKLRGDYYNGSKALLTLEDLRQGAQGDISEMVPGRRITVLLGEPGVSKFTYNAIILDAKKDFYEIVHHYSVVIVPRCSAQDWVHVSEEGQWVTAARIGAARLLLVLLDSSNSIYSKDDIKTDIYPLAKQLAPSFRDYYTFHIPITFEYDGISRRVRVHQVVSDLSGGIVVEDVKKFEYDYQSRLATGSMYRRLIFERAENQEQSQVVLSWEGSTRESEEEIEPGAYLWREMEVVDNALVSSYHYAVISGIMLMSSHTSGIASHGSQVITVILGLGGGSLPMFMKKILPCSVKFVVVELDPVVLDVAEEYFGFKSDEDLKVHIGEGVDFIKNLAKYEKVNKPDILVVDVDSCDPSGGLTSPAPGFVDEEFLVAAKKALSEKGLLIMNLITRCSTWRVELYKRLKKVFGHYIYRLTIEADVNEVVFASKASLRLSESRDRLANSFEWTQKVVDTSYFIDPVP